MKHVIQFLFLLVFVTSTGAQPSTFKHVVTAANRSANQTIVDHARTNGQPSKIIFITHDYGSGPYITGPSVVRYSGSKWRIVRLDGRSMANNSTYNVLVQTTADRGALVHRTTSANTSLNQTTINHPLANGDPNAKIIVTQRISSSGVRNNHSIGVYYAGGRWRIFNQDRANLGIGVEFNVLINHPRAFTHRHTSSASSHLSALNHTSTNDHPQAMLFQTQNWGTLGPYNNHEVGTWYSGGKWYIYNEDRVQLPSGARFNVIAIDLSVDLNGYYSCNDGGHYYVRQLGNKVYWFGEHPNGNWANVFSGELVGHTLRGQFYDVPKGRAQGSGSLQISVGSNGNSMRKSEWWIWGIAVDTITIAWHSARRAIFWFQSCQRIMQDWTGSGIAMMVAVTILGKSGERSYGLEKKLLRVEDQIFPILL